MAKDNKFMFYETFMDAIEILPEEQRAEACYEFCKYGIYGELPKNECLKMFCIGVSCSVKKYQGSGGKREGAGRPSKNQINQKNQIEQTQTKTKTKTQTKIETKPTMQQIKDYCIERNNNVDYKRFYDYYESANWKDSRGKPIKNWKQKMIAVWETKQENKNTSSYIEEQQRMYEYVN